MKKISVIKGVMLFLAALFLAMFIIENFDPVPLYIPFLKGRKVGMMFIILAAYILGAATVFVAMRNIGVGNRKKSEIDKDDGREELYDEE
jgi:uncharacterized integral membrane protein